MKLFRTAIAVCITILAAACQKQQSDQPLMGGSDAIRFASPNTKAIVSDAAQLQAGLSLFGFTKDSKSVEEVLFDGNNLTYTAGAWTYSGGTRYWIPESQYSFLAFYPMADADTYVRSEKSITVSHTTGYTYGAQNDLLAGCTYRQFEKKASVSAAVEPVELNMKHLLSSVQIKVKNTSSDLISITGASTKLTGLYQSGNCTVTPVEGNSSYTVNWVTTGERVTDATTFQGDIADISGMAISATNAVSLFKEPILVIPQAISTNDIKISIYISSSSTTKEVSLRNAANITAWEPGKQYTYEMSVSDRYINFSLTVNDWNDNPEIDLQ